MCANECGEEDALADFEGVLKLLHRDKLCANECGEEDALADLKNALKLLHHDKLWVQMSVEKTILLQILKLGSNSCITNCKKMIKFATKVENEHKVDGKGQTNLSYSKFKISTAS